MEYYQKITFYTFVVLFQWTCILAARAHPVDSTTVIRATNAIPPAVKDELHRTFEGLTRTTRQDEAIDPIVVSQVVADTVEAKRAYAQSLLEKVKKGQRFVDALDALSEIELPVGLVKSGGAADYSILIDRITFTPKGAILDVYVSLTLPQSGEHIAFHGNIPLSNDGGIAGNAKVFLVGDHNLKFGSSIQLTVKGTEHTYVEFDCNGFKGVSIEAILQFSRDLIVPEDENGNPSKNENDRVKVNFTTYVQSLNDLMARVSIPAFQIKGLNGFGFKITEAFLDWSDLANPPGIQFPKDYPSPFVQAGQPLLWQGFYLQKLEIRFPPAFSKKDNPGRITLGVEQMILDDQGFTGEVYAEHVLSTGDMSGWAFTLDHAELAFVTNQVKGFELRGKISVPNLKKQKDNTATEFGYIASRDVKGDYMFAVSIHESLRLPLFVADLTLLPGSSISVKEKENKFYPTAILNGSLTIKALDKGPKASFNGIGFEGLRISSEAPHFDIQSISFGKEGNEQSISKFPLTIKNIALKKDGPDRIGIGLDVTINIAGKSSDEGFGGTASLTLWGKRGEENTTSADGTTDTQKGSWKFDKVELSGVGINFKKGGVIEIAGMINFFDNDPVYGDGFKGSVSGKIQIISLKIEALFGRTPEFRYWYADALVEFSSGIPLVPGFSAYGFGGGYYSRMKQSTDGSGSSLGRNASGITYVPDANTIGIKAMVKFGATPSQAPYNGDVMLEVALNTHGGINSVTFTGNLVVMAPVLPGALDKLKSLASAAIGGKADQLLKVVEGQVSASVKILFDNVNDVFHANMDIYINIVGGIVKGVGVNNRAGWAVMHFSRDEWYVLIGTPSNPVGLELLWLLKIKSYFMIGQNLPGSPPPPKLVSEILGGKDLDYMRDLNAAKSGFGFAFGIDLSMDTGDVSFLMFYGRFAAGIGADVMVKKYDDQYHCVGSDETIGINGWFANGQAYAYLMCKIGIKVNLRFYKGNYEILNFGAAAVMQAKGPNPFWMRGIVGGYYRILGGLVKGHCNFEITIGKECKIVGNSNPLADVSLISELSPKKGETNIDVFNAPQAAFNISVGDVFTITDIEGRRRSFRGRLVEFAVTEGQSTLPGKVRWNDDNDVAAFDTHDVLPSNKEIKVRVRLTFEELVNGSWQTLLFEGKEVEETKETNFTSGVGPDHIPPSNVLVSYPMVNQLNFYPKEYNQGFIQLQKGQPELFNPGPEWKQSLYFTNADAKTNISTTLSYSASDNRISFNIPNGFQNDRLHKLEILNVPSANARLDANVQNVESKIESTGDTLTTKKIEGDLDLRDAKIVYGAPFRTSKFNTFVEKMKDIKLHNTINDPAETGDLTVLRNYILGVEALEKMELEKLGEVEPLTKAHAVLQGNRWYESIVYPLVYQGYPLNGKFTTDRDTTEYGMPATRAGYLNQIIAAPTLDPAAQAAAAPPLSGSLWYDIMRPMKADFKDIQRKIANYVANKPNLMNDRFENILTKPFPFYRQGKYYIRIRYQLPGTTQTTSSYDFELYNAVPD